MFQPVSLIWPQGHTRRPVFLGSGFNVLVNAVPQMQTAPTLQQDFWPYCLACLEQELPAQQINNWIKPLTVEYACSNGDGSPSLTLKAPNRFFLQWVRDRYLRRISELGEEFHGVPLRLDLQLAPMPATPAPAPIATALPNTGQDTATARSRPSAACEVSPMPETSVTPDATGIKLAYEKTRLNTDFSFDTLVTGHANNLASAAAMHVAQNPGASQHNPFFIYGGSGLGKTHLVHAIGNTVFHRNPRMVVRYMHAEDFATDVIRAYQQKGFDALKRYYRSLDLLIIDDIQCFGTKERTKEEFFHAFNALTEAKKQIIITCDTYPKDIQGLEDRLISRFGWGLTVQVEAPELEMRIAILQKKAEALQVQLDGDVAFLIAKNLRSNVRELEGALNKVVAFARFNGRSISLDLAREALKDLLNAYNRQLSIEHIQKTVADYYRIKTSDMLSKKRIRVIARPRQVAMYLAKELTSMSLPAIGEAFGGRDHTTVLHACRTVSGLCQRDQQLNHDVHVLTQTLRG